MGKRIKPRKIVKYYYEEETLDKKKLKYLLILLLFTGILLSTTTYAWFTTNRVVSVDTLDVKVEAAGSIEISADAINWKASLTKEDIMQVHSTTYPTSINQLPAIIEPTSTAGTVSNGLLNMYLGKVSSNDEGEFTLTSTKESESETNGENSTANFVAYDIFLKTNESKDLYLTNESSVVYNGDTSTGTENAMRVAFVIEGNIASASSATTAQSLKTNDNNNVYIWEPNYDTHTGSGVNNAKDIYGIITTQTGGTIISCDGVISEITSGVPIKNAKSQNYPNYFQTVTPKITTTKGFSNYQTLFKIEAGITKIRVYMWLEGQDVDCENNASVGGLTLKLQFSTNPS